MTVKCHQSQKGKHHCRYLSYSKANMGKRGFKRDMKAKGWPRKMKEKIDSMIVRWGLDPTFQISFVDILLVIAGKRRSPGAVVVPIVPPANGRWRPPSFPFRRPAALFPVAVAVVVTIPVVSSARTARALTIPARAVGRRTPVIAPDGGRRVLGPLLGCLRQQDVICRKINKRAWMLKRDPSKYLPCL